MQTKKNRDSYNSDKTFSYKKPADTLPLGVLKEIGDRINTIKYCISQYLRVQTLKCSFTINKVGESVSHHRPLAPHL